MANIEQIQVGSTTYDIASSGYAISNTYSSAEKAVGTWIDGKTIYQKTFTTTCPNATTEGTPVSGSYVSIGASVDNIIGYSGMLRRTTGRYYTLPDVNNIDNSQPNLGLKTCRITFETNSSSSNKNSFLVSNSWSQLNGGTVYVTILYTKV